MSVNKQEPHPGADALVIEDLEVSFGSARPAVGGITIRVRPGEIVAVVGESGSGKTMTAMAALGLLPPLARWAGRIEVAGLDLRSLGREQLRAVRGRDIAMVFQDPGSWRDPRLTSEEWVAEPLVIAGTDRAGRAGRAARVAGLLESVRLDPAVRARYPHELSGGQRQRVSIARAIALQPELLVADEPTSALDVSVQATVLDLLLDLQAELGFACLFITHDLAVVSFLADRIAVMRSGRLVEIGPRDEVLFAPRHAYTQRLVAAAPVPDPVQQRERRQARLSLEPGPSMNGPAA